MIEQVQLYLETYLGLGTTLGRPDVSYEGQNDSAAVYWGGCTEHAKGPAYRTHNIIVQFKSPSPKEYVDANEINEVRDSALALLDWLHTQRTLAGWLINWPIGGPNIVTNPDQATVDVHIPVCQKFP